MRKMMNERTDNKISTKDIDCFTDKLFTVNARRYRRAAHANFNT